MIFLFSFGIYNTSFIDFTNGDIFNWISWNDNRYLICVDALKDKPVKYFSKPLKDWALSEEDEKTIDELVKQKIK